MSWIKVKAKREEVAKLVSRAGEILKAAHNEKRELSNEENTNFDTLHGDAEKIKGDIRNLEVQMDAEKSVENRLGRDDIEVSEPKNQDELGKRAFEKLLRYGSHSLSADERKAHEQRAMSAGTANQGAEFVPEDFYNSFVEVLKDYNGVREAGCTVISTSAGNQLQVPFLNDISNVGELISENAAANDAGADPDTGELSLGAYIYSSKVVKASKMLIQDSAFDVQGWLAPALSTRIGRIQNTHLTVGTGTAQPQGVVTGSTLGKTATAIAAITYNEMLDLIHSLDRSYRKNAKFMFNDSTLLALRKLVDGSGNPLWSNGNVISGVADNLAGHSYVVNNDMEALATGKKTVLFGDFKQSYIIREVKGVELIVFTEKYANNLQQGYLAWNRMDAGVVDSSAMKHLIQA